MITCDFFGGMGNNLYQLATVYNIHRTRGFDLVLPKTCERVNAEYYGQPNYLEIMNLLDNDFNYADQPTTPYYYEHSDLNLSTTDYSYDGFEPMDNVNYRGHFQSYKYFEDTDITNEFILNQKVSKELMDKYGDLFNKKTLSIHYRLAGDRIENRIQYFHKTVSVDYYQKALSYYNLEEYNILVISDNTQLAEQLLGNHVNFHYIDNNKDNIKDFILMSMCQNNILGNSTFGWWAAYLNKNPNKKIVCPKSEWFGPGYQHFNLKDTFPQSWIQL